MRKEAEAHAAEDKHRRDLIDARNSADNSVYGAEKALSELGDKVPAELKTEVQAAVEEVKKAKEGEDEAVIRKAVEALSQVVQKVGVAAYQQQTPPPPPAGDESGSKAEPKDEGPEVVEGETKDV